jgi:FMN phosphatase YigB (HAD superfamily)
VGHGPRARLRPRLPWSPLPDGQAERLVELYDHLRPFPDAAPVLRALAGLGYELAVFSNGTPAMIGNCLSNSVWVPEILSCR